jgi:hypothetical protein
MEPNRLYIDLPDDLRETIERSGLTLTDILQAEGAPAGLRAQPAPLPATLESAGARDRALGFEIVVTPELLLSAAAAASFVILALSKFLRDRARDPKVVEVWQEKTVTGDDGVERILLVREHRFIEPASAAGAEFEAKLDWAKGAVLRFSSQEHDPEPGAAAPAPPAPRAADGPVD